VGKRRYFESKKRCVGWSEMQTLNCEYPIAGEYLDGLNSYPNVLFFTAKLSLHLLNLFYKSDIAPGASTEKTHQIMRDNLIIITDQAVLFASGGRRRSPAAGRKMDATRFFSGA
jgi:hypothetical protein